jgi:glutathione S-transferase
LPPHPGPQFESGALLLYLADKYPLKSGIWTPQQRAAAAQWTLFANSTLANVSARH